MRLKKKIALIGAGNMGEAIIKGTLNTCLTSPKDIFIYDISKGRMSELKKTHGIITCGSSAEAVDNTDIIILAVKPQSMNSALSDIKTNVKKRHIIISIAAGVKIDKLKNGLHADSRIIRVMPNTPCLVQSGISAYAYKDKIKDNEIADIVSLLNSVGASIRIEEDLLDAVTGLSGSGPAYIALITEALTDAGVKVGMTRETSKKLALHTVYGTAKLLIETGMSPAQLKDMVTSPGGTTIYGMHRLEEGGVRSSIINAVEDATKRANELGKI